MQPVINFQYYALYVYIYLCTIFICQLIYKLVYVYYILEIFFFVTINLLINSVAISGGAKRVGAILCLSHEAYTDIHTYICIYI